MVAVVVCLVFMNNMEFFLSIYSQAVSQAPLYEFSNLLTALLNIWVAGRTPESQLINFWPLLNIWEPAPELQP